ncbi:hypothetical protein [Escherichia coli]
MNCSATFITYESVQRYIVKPVRIFMKGDHSITSIEIG